MFLDKKKVLFIAPEYHYLHTKIVESLNKQGAVVTFYPEVPYSKLHVFVRKFTFHPINKMLDSRYFKKIIDNILPNQYDIFFLIRGGMISDEFLDKLQKKLPNCQFIMYQWDSLVHNDFLSKIKYFDRVLTFDKLDANKNNIGYLPLFFTDEYLNISNKIDQITNDIIFIGTYHTHRLKIIKLIDKYCKEKNLKFKYHLYISTHQKWLMFLKGQIKFSDMKYFRTYKLSLSDIVKLYEESTIVLDIEMTNQTGLTIRTIEALGANRKLLTTNKQIKQSDIFDDNFIQILDIDNIYINDKISLLQEANKKYKEYYIDNWLKNILISKDL